MLDILSDNLGFIALAVGTITATVGGATAYTKYWIARGRERGSSEYVHSNLQKEIEGIHDCITGLEETVSRTRKDIYQRYDHIHGEIKEVTGKVDTVINMMKRNGH